MLGPLNDMTVEQAIMVGIQAACVFAKEKQLELTHIETSHMGIFELISNQELFVIPEELLEAFRLFNSIHANNPSHALNDPHEDNSRKISWIPEHMNSSASYMAEYARLHLSEPVELPGDSTLGNLQFFLDRDMGRVLNNPDIMVMPLMGLGEVIDPPCNTLKRKRVEYEQDEFGGPWDCLVPSADLHNVVLNPSAAVHSWSIIPPASLPGNKGKGKHYDNYSFYDRGSLSQKAIAILDSGALSRFSPCFCDKALNLELPVGDVSLELFAKDVLHYACLDTLGILEPMFLPLPAPDKQFMTIDQMLLEMGLHSSSPQVVSAVKDAGVVLGGTSSVGVGSISSAAQRGRRAASV
ncbi:hypothetical protein DCAR_0728941 [Daucus carota subsp. sativus]|uniref:Uncharacterized protein n=1 Tax=Daucus carota subsp. sativus TaxID=79200 RepID=A0A161ZLJ9_DAUCS|nr:hypothetical protein DCAR_0728941 [Daucus carota subsp. sativus]